MKLRAEIDTWERGYKMGEHREGGGREQVRGGGKKSRKCDKGEIQVQRVGNRREVRKKGGKAIET